MKLSALQSRLAILILAVALLLPAVVFGASATLRLEAREASSDSISCPWVYTWNGKAFVQDNDIYSVARYPQGEYTDYYLLQKPLAEADGSYPIEIREIAAEISWTDMVGLTAVDHGADSAIGTDSNGNIFSYRPAALIAPVSAQASTGADVTAALVTKDNAGFGAFSEEFVTISFGAADISQGGLLVLRAKGFNEGQGVSKPFIGPPAVVVQAFNSATGTWDEIGRLKPRFDWSENVFDVSSVTPDANGNIVVRLFSISHDAKYHIIDFAALATGPQPAFSVKSLPLATADFNGTDVRAVLGGSDNDYLRMQMSEKFSVSFTAAPQTDTVRDFIFISEGYYIPSGTYYIYTWDGAEWVERASYDFDIVDEVHDFDLSAYLPDADGEYKVRIYQDYNTASAAVDFAGMTVDGTTWNLLYAEELGDAGGDVAPWLAVSDDISVEWSSGSYRWIEARWLTPFAVVTPNGGEMIGSGSTYTVTWNPATFVGPVTPNVAQIQYKLFYSLDAGSTWEQIASGLTGTSYNWQVPVVKKNMKNCLVKIVAYMPGTYAPMPGAAQVIAEDTSDAVFEIAVVQLLTPNGGETVKKGGSCPVTWTSGEAAGNVFSTVLQYNCGGGWSTFAVLGGNPGSYNWTLHKKYRGGNCKVKVILKGVGGAKMGADASDSTFVIQ